jgi:hypothetical protein
MNIFPNMKLKAKALLTTGSILLVVLGANTALNIYSATSKYTEALVARATVLADTVKKDIDKAVGFGLAIFPGRDGRTPARAHGPGPGPLADHGDGHGGEGALCERRPS